MHQDSFSADTEQRLQPAQELTLQELAAILRTETDFTSPSDACGGSEQQKQSLIQSYVSQHFPEPPADLSNNLQLHLVNVQNTVLNELTRLSPLLDEQMMGHLIECYHRQTFNQLHSLLQNISSSQDSFVLMKWCLKTYLRYSIYLSAYLENQQRAPALDTLSLWLIITSNYLLCEKVHIDQKTGLH